MQRYDSFLRHLRNLSPLTKYVLTITNLPTQAERVIQKVMTIAANIHS
jgi:hypothetical protein